MRWRLHATEMALPKNRIAGGDPCMNFLISFLTAGRVGERLLSAHMGRTIVDETMEPRRKVWNGCKSSGAGPVHLSCDDLMRRKGLGSVAKSTRKGKSVWEILGATRRALWRKAWSSVCNRSAASTKGPRQGLRSLPPLQAPRRGIELRGSFIGCGGWTLGEYLCCTVPYCGLRRRTAIAALARRHASGGFETPTWQCRLARMQIIQRPRRPAGVGG